MNLSLEWFSSEIEQQKFYSEIHHQNSTVLVELVLLIFKRHSVLFFFLSRLAGCTD